MNPFKKSYYHVGVILIDSPVENPDVVRLDGRDELFILKDDKRTLLPLLNRDSYPVTYSQVLNQR